MREFVFIPEIPSVCGWRTDIIAMEGVGLRQAQNKDYPAVGTQEANHWANKKNKLLKARSESSSEAAASRVLKLFIEKVHCYGGPAEEETLFGSFWTALWRCTVTVLTHVSMLRSPINCACFVWASHTWQ